MAWKVVIPQDITDIGKDYLRERGYEITVGSGSLDLEVLKREVADADGLLVRTAPYPAEVIAAAPRVKVISRHGVGVNNIDLAYCREHGIVVTFAPEANAGSVAEHTVGMMVAAAHNFARFDRGVREGEWEFRNQYKGRDLDGKTLGLIGVGRIGQKVAHIAAAFGMKVIGFDAFVPEDRFPAGIGFRPSADAVFAEADFISLHVPATPETANLVCQRTIGLMKSDAIIINCARGGVVNEDDLAEALKSGRIFGAALDVLEDEPPRPDHPLFSLPNVLLTPHSAALTAEAMDRMGLHAAMGIHSVLSGEKPKWPVKL